MIVRRRAVVGTFVGRATVAIPAGQQPAGGRPDIIGQVADAVGNGVGAVGDAGRIAARSCARRRRDSVIHHRRGVQRRMRYGDVLADRTGAGRWPEQHDGPDHHRRGGPAFRAGATQPHGSTPSADP
jgi:hypothetical protein